MDTIREAMAGGASKAEIAEAVEMENRLAEGEAEGWRAEQRKLTEEISGKVAKVVGAYERRGGVVYGRLFDLGSIELKSPGEGRTTLRVYQTEDERLWSWEGEVPTRGRAIDPDSRRAVYWRQGNRRAILIREYDAATVAAIRFQLEGV